MKTTKTFGTLNQFEAAVAEKLCELTNTNESVESASLLKSLASQNYEGYKIKKTKTGYDVYTGKEKQDSDFASDDAAKEFIDEMRSGMYTAGLVTAAEDGSEDLELDNVVESDAEELADAEAISISSEIAEDKKEYLYQLCNKVIDLFIPEEMLCTARVADDMIVLYISLDTDDLKEADITFDEISFDLDKIDEEAEYIKYQFLDSLKPDSEEMQMNYDEDKPASDSDKIFMTPTSDDEIPEWGYTM